MIAELTTSYGIRNTVVHVLGAEWGWLGRGTAQ
jgi:hypothetical protein